MVMTQQPKDMGTGLRLFVENVIEPYTTMERENGNISNNRDRTKCTRRYTISSERKKYYDERFYSDDFKSRIKTIKGARPW